VTPHADFVIIGGGAAAFAAAIRANDHGAKTVLINQGLPLGGTCVNVGCVPSKTLVWAAGLLHQTRHHGIPGLRFDTREFDFAKIIGHEQAMVDQLRREKYERVIAGLPHVEVIAKRARFVSPNTLDVDGDSISADKILIAVGSSATVPAIAGLREAGFLTHIEALRRTMVPKKLIVIGTGPLGLEFAQVYARFGSQVTMLQRGTRFFPRTEPALADRLREVLQRESIVIETGAVVRSVRVERGRKVVTYSTGRPHSVDLDADEILLATGKTPNTADLGLGAIGVSVDDRLAVKVSPDLRTTEPHIYAAGDVTNLPKRLETTAGKEGTLAADNALTGSAQSIDYDTVPYTVFTDPQLAGVGLTEDEQMTRLGHCACRTVAFDQVPRARIVGRSEGLIKMAIHPETDQIMGVHIVSSDASELVAEAMMLVRNRNTIRDVLDSLPVFPTLSESIKLAAMAFTRDISKVSCCV
jgi:mercuric reductase